MKDLKYTAQQIMDFLIITANDQPKYLANYKLPEVRFYIPS